MITKLREAGYMVVRPEFPTDPPKVDDPAEIARRIGLRVAGPDDIVVSRAWLRTRVPAHASLDEFDALIWKRRGRDRARAAALSQPHPEETP